MVVLNLSRSANELVDAFNVESRVLKVRMNLGGFAWVVDQAEICVENGFCLIGNNNDTQRCELKRLAYALGITAIII